MHKHGSCRYHALALTLTTACALVASPASATGVCDNAERILACYHRSAEFERCEVEREISREATREEARGVIYFKGAMTKKAYKLEYAMPVQNNEFRIRILSDMAPFRPNVTCAFNDWQPLR